MATVRKIERVKLETANLHELITALEELRGKYGDLAHVQDNIGEYFAELIVRETTLTDNSTVFSIELDNGQRD